MNVQRYNLSRNSKHTACYIPLPTRHLIRDIYWFFIAVWLVDIWRVINWRTKIEEFLTSLLGNSIVQRGQQKHRQARFPVQRGKCRTICIVKFYVPKIKLSFRYRLFFWWRARFVRDVNVKYGRRGYKIC